MDAILLVCVWTADFDTTHHTLMSDNDVITVNWTPMHPCMSEIFYCIFANRFLCKGIWSNKL